VTLLQTSVVPGVHRLGAPFVNWYLVEDEGGLTAVDAGLPRFIDDLEDDLRALERRAPDVDAVVLTHSDSDHTGVAATLRDTGGARVLIHAADEETLVKPGPKGGEASPRHVVPWLWRPQAWRFFIAMALGGGARPTGVHGAETFAGGDVLDVPGHPRVIHTPGHTAGHCALLFEGRGALFVGDAMCTWNPLTGKTGPQLMPRPTNVSNADALASLQRIAEVHARVILPGHGEPWHGPPATAVERARSRS
jgi:glyoxylase-like metal-dependent hydrolase (beta-lactamase superfamily II)